MSEKNRKYEAKEAKYHNSEVFHSHKERSEDDSDNTVTNNTAENNKHQNIYDVGVVDESFPHQNDDDDATVDDDTVEKMKF